MSSPNLPYEFAGPLRTGPVQYVNVEVGDGRVVRCVSGGLFLVHHGDAPLALVLSRGERPYGPDNVLRVEGRFRALTEAQISRHSVSTFALQPAS